MVRRLLELSARMLEFELAAEGTGPADIAEIVRDFANLRRYVHFIFVVKCTHWQQLPWILFGVAHSNIAIARQCCKRALQLSAASQHPEGEHMLSQLLCAPGGRGYAEMVQFIRSGVIDPAGFMLRMLARMRFAITSERWVESLHAANKHWLASCNRAGPVHVALFAALPALRQFLHEDEGADQQDSSNIAKLAAHTEVTQDMKRCLEEVGF